MSFFTNDDTLYFEIQTTSGGVPVDADSTPDGVLVSNGTDTATAVNITSEGNGVYTVDTSLSGRSVGDIVYVRITATIGGEDYQTVKGPFRVDKSIDSRLASDIADLNKAADFILRRNLANVDDGDSENFRSLLGAIRKLTNRVDIDGSTLTVYKEDDSTSAGTQTVTTNANADPIVEVDTD